jgi:hypothetical protein
VKKYKLTGNNLLWHQNITHFNPSTSPNAQQPVARPLIDCELVYLSMISF